MNCPQDQGRSPNEREKGTVYDTASGEMRLLSKWRTAFCFRVAGKEGAAGTCWVESSPIPHRPHCLLAGWSLYSNANTRRRLCQAHGGRMDRLQLCWEPERTRWEREKGCTGACQPGGNPERAGVLRKSSIWDPAPHGHPWNTGSGQGSVYSRGRQLSRSQAAQFNTAVPLSDPDGASQLL